MLYFLVLPPKTIPENFTIGFMISKHREFKDILEKVVPYSVELFNNKSEDVKLNVVLQEYDPYSMYEVTEACCGLVRDNVSVVISGDGSDSIASLADIFNPLNIPVVSSVATDPHLRRGVRDKILLLAPADSLQSHALTQILQFFIWQEVSIIASDSNYGINGVTHLQQLLLQSHESKIHSIIKSISFFHASEDPEHIHIEEVLQDIRESLSRVIVMHSEVRYAKVVLRRAHEMNMMSRGYVWIVTDGITGNSDYLMKNGRYPSYLEGLLGIGLSIITDSAQFKEFKDDIGEALNITGVDITPNVVKLYDSITLVGNALRNISKAYNNFTSPRCITCAKRTKWDFGDSFFSHLTRQVHEGVSGPFKFSPRGTLITAKYDILNFVYPGNFFRIGSWVYPGVGLSMDYDRNSGLVKFLGSDQDHTSVPSGLANTLTGQHLKLGITNSPPFAFKDTNCNDTTGMVCWKGVCPDIIADFAKTLNFSYEYVEPKDGKFGSLNKETLQWSGLIGEMLAHSTDMIVIDLSVSYERKEYIDFTVSFMDSGISLALKGESGKNNLFFFLGPFHSSVWVCILAVVFLASIVQNLFNKLSPYGSYGKRVHAIQVCKCSKCAERRALKYYKGVQFKSQSTSTCLFEESVFHGPENEDMTVYNSLWIIAAGYAGQGGQSLPSSPSGRFFLMTWWLFVMMITCMYTANLTAFMTLDKLGVTIDSAKGLLSQDKYKWGIVDHSFLEYLLKNNVDREYRMLLHGAEKLSSISEGIERVHQGYFVFIDESLGMDYNIKNMCNVFKIQTEFQSFDYAFGLPKNSPYLALLNSLMLKKREQAYFADLWKKWIERSGDLVSHSCQTEIGSNESLQFNTLKGIFLLLGFGLGVSIILIVIEWAFAAANDDYDLQHKSYMSKFLRRVSLKLHDINTEWLNLPIISTNSMFRVMIQWKVFQQKLDFLIYKFKAELDNRSKKIRKGILLLVVILLIGTVVTIMNNKIVLGPGRG